MAAERVTHGLGGPLLKTPNFYFRGTGLIPGQGTKIPHGACTAKKKKKRVTQKVG